MKMKLLIAGAIVAVIIVCIVAMAAISMVSSGLVKSSQGVFSVTGYVVDTNGEGISGMDVTLHVMGHNGSAVNEIYNMTATTQGAQAYAGLFVFDNAIISPDDQYAYLSTSAYDDNITYYGRSDNFTLYDHALVNQNVVLHVPYGYANASQSQTSSAARQLDSISLQSPVPTAQNENSVSGYVVDSSGNGVANVMVTLHIMGAGQGSGEKELCNLTMATNNTKSFMGLFVFNNIVAVKDMKDAYVSTSALVNNTTIYGETNNFTINENSATNLYIVLHLPTKSVNTT